MNGLHMEDGQLIGPSLFESWRESHHNTPVRLLGLGVSGLEEAVAGRHNEGDS